MPRCVDCANYGGARDSFYHPSPCTNCDPMYVNYTEKPRIPIALDKQEGGQHYKDKAIQPIVYIHANKLGFCEGNVVKYITRHKEKNGAEDIRKVIHYCELLLELEYKNENM
jgi:Protein of unknwon function (DUF3310)